MAFQENSDPIKDLGIGYMFEIKEFCRTHFYRDKDPDHFLMTCVILNKPEYVKYLIENFTFGYSELTAVMQIARYHDNKKIVQILKTVK
jgi:hypothetical protein